MSSKISYKEVVRLIFAQNYSQREIAIAGNCSEGTVRNIKQRLERSGIDGPTALEMSESELRGLLNENRGRKCQQAFMQPDYQKIDEELSKNRKLSLAILWEEYVEECKQKELRPYMYSHFVGQYRRWQNFNIPSLRISHIPADKMEVDWAGDTMSVVDQLTGEIIKVYLFVATLPYSQYTFVWPTLSMTTDDWIDANVRALHFFGGVPRIIACDNLKTGVVKHSHDEIVLNKTYQEFGNFYNTAIIPTGVRKPKEKASVEGSVGKIGERIALMLRKQTFFTIDELREAVEAKLEDLNSRPFQKRKDGSRQSVFLEKEKAHLGALPPTDFEVSRWESRTVTPDYRVHIDGSTYSVPYAFIGQKVEVRVGKNVIEVFCDGERIASHVRTFEKNEDVKQVAHQPKWHTEYLEQSAEKYIARAKCEIGVAAMHIVESMMSAGKSEKEGYRPAAKLLSLLDTYEAEQIEKACARALDISKAPSLKSIKILLKSQVKRDEAKDALSDYAILRDKDYYTE